MFKWLSGIWLSGVMFLIVAFSAQAADTSALSIGERKELAVFGLRAMGINAGIELIKNVPQGDDLETMIETGLNLNGHLCAKLLSIQPLVLERGHTYEAICVAYRGGQGTKTYVIEALKGVAFEP